MSHPPHNEYFNYTWRGVRILDHNRWPSEEEASQTIWFHPVLDAMTGSYGYLTRIIDEHMGNFMYERRRAGLPMITTFDGTPPDILYWLNRRLFDLVNEIVEERNRQEDEARARHLTTQEIRDTVFKLRKPDYLPGENWRKFLGHRFLPGAA